MGEAGVAKSRRFFKSRAGVTAIVLVIAVAGAFAISGLSGSDGPAGTSPTTSTRLAGPTGSSPSIDGNIVTVVGTINKVVNNGDLVVNDGHVDYTIALTATTKVADLSGGDVARDLLQEGEAVQVTGSLVGSTITAQSVLLPSPPTPVSTT